MTAASIERGRAKKTSVSSSEINAGWQGGGWGVASLLSPEFLTRYQQSRHPRCHVTERREETNAKKFRCEIFISVAAHRLGRNTSWTGWEILFPRTRAVILTVSCFPFCLLSLTCTYICTHTHICCNVARDFCIKINLWFAGFFSRLLNLTNCKIFVCLFPQLSLQNESYYWFLCKREWKNN